MADQNDDLTKVQSLLSGGKYSTQQIRESLLRSGYAAGDADNLISRGSGALGGPKEDTFMGESGLSGLGELGNYFQQKGITPPTVWGALKAAGKGQWDESAKELKAMGGTDWGNPDSRDAALMHLVGAVPLIGHPLAHLGSNVAQGNFGGAAGDIAALFGPKLAEIGARGVSAGGKAVGQQLYRSQLPFASTVSRGDIAGAVNEGIEQRRTVPGLFSNPDTDSISKIGFVGKPGSYMDEMNKKIQPYVSGVSGAQKANAGTLFQPFLKKVGDLIDAPTQGGRAIAEGMLEQVRPTLEDLNPGIASTIFNRDPKVGPVLTPEQKYSAIQSWTSNNFNFDVAKVHSIKQKAYKTLGSSAYSDKARESAPSGSLDTNVSLAAGAKNAVAEIHPEVNPYLQHEHDTLTLKRALEEASKSNPKEFDILKNLAVGSTIGGGAHLAGLGINESAGAGVLGALALQAMKSPRIATQLGVILGKRFPQVADAVRPFVMPVGVAGDVAGQAGRSGSEDIQKLFDAPVQK